MKKIVNPSQIRLSELPEEGRTYVYTKEGNELNEALKELIQGADFQVEVHIQPMGNAYEIRAKIKTQLDLVCSRCAFEFVHPIDEFVREVVVIEKDMGRTEKSGRVNHTSEWDQEGPFTIVQDQDEFDIAEYIREHIALAEPQRPMGGNNCDETCENLQMAMAKGWLDESDGSLEKDPNNPFSILKDLKLNS